jgi:hypothetical protein
MSWRTGEPHVGTKWQKESSPLLQPVNPQTFLTPSSRLYSIGSCFAANLNRWLEHQGFAVPQVSWGMHYNARTILYELRRAAGMPAPTLDWTVRKRDGSTMHVDALRHCIDAPGAAELARIKETIASASRVAFQQADCFLITLGLSDIWELVHEGEPITLNRAPYSGSCLPDRQVAPHATNRFMSVEECAEDLRQIVDIIRAHKPAGTPIVFTVSPVPLKHTGHDVHPAIANSRSKAVLLAAIFTFLDAAPPDRQISYFPSFEFFQSNPLDIELWQPDHRHPTASAIATVAEAFVAAYGHAPIEVKPGFTVPLFA